MPYNNPHIKGWLRVILIFIAYLFVAAIFQLIAALIADVDMRKSLSEANDSQRLVVVFSDFIGFLMVLWFFLKIVDNESFFGIGLKLKNRVKDIWIGLILGLMIMGFALLFLLSIDEIVFQKINNDFEKLIYMFCLYVLVSLKEEFLFRGYILRNFMYSFNKPSALILSSLLFSIVHGFNPNFDFQAFIGLFLAGLLLGISYTYTKNLWFPIALHFSWNFFQSLFGFKVSGLDSYSLIHFEIPENNIINGGTFGFEGSILSIIVQIVFITTIYFFYSKK